MASHFESVGLSVESPDGELQASMPAPSATAARTATRDGGRMAVWADPSGDLLAGRVLDAGPA
jgi:hypothetical protein